ncbi:MAG TPA: hypothetical protein DEP72_07180 [Clostridiales bacterium]|nr:hypothetical protein [Clostridiales bacterium]
MAGKIYQMVQKIVKERSNGVPMLETSAKTKLLLKGINTANYNPSSEDDEKIIKKLEDIAKEWGISI